MLILQGRNESSESGLIMAYRVSQPVVDEALTSFLSFVLVLVVTVAVAVGVGSYLGIVETQTLLERLSEFAIHLTA